MVQNNRVAYFPGNKSFSQDGGKYREILGNTGKYWEIPGNTGKYRECNFIFSFFLVYTHVLIMYLPSVI